VLVVDGTGPIEAVKRSSAILRQKWGEAAGGESGFGLIFFALAVPALLLVVFAGSLGGAAMIPAILIAILYIAVLSLIVITLSTLFRTGVYIYATTGQAPVSIGEDLIQGSFRKN